jgi:hypothetical protein
MTEYVTGRSFYYGELLTLIVRWFDALVSWAGNVGCSFGDSSREVVEIGLP